ncbi:hypothetical protein HAX54_030082 [Datura stramonium]|uniref:Uncharacterized protein n=1 Tax=Datura stramonium TaxID=4076 RepID=A0ABS8VA34_DATST|nr:hypothetical protein [Datura stramonium]
MQPSNVNILEISHQISQDNSESVVGPNSRKLLPTSKLEQKAISIPHGRTTAKTESNSHKQPTETMSVFDGTNVVLKLRKNFILEAWTKIRDKLSGLTVDCASSIKEKVRVILKDMYEKGVDISPLKNLLESFFGLATSYDQARSTLTDMIAEVKKSESICKSQETS